MFRCVQIAPVGKVHIRISNPVTTYTRYRGSYLGLWHIVVDTRHDFTVFMGMFSSRNLDGLPHLPLDLRSSQFVATGIKANYVTTFVFLKV